MPTEYTKMAQKIRDFKPMVTSKANMELAKKIYADNLLKQRRKELAEILLEVPELVHEIAHHIKEKEDIYYSPLSAGSYVDIFNEMAKEWAN